MVHKQARYEIIYQVSPLIVTLQNDRKHINIVSVAAQDFNATIFRGRWQTISGIDAMIIKWDAECVTYVTNNRGPGSCGQCQYTFWFN